MKPYKYIISGGGTGGHIYPAIAIANELAAQDPSAKIVFVGGRGKMEMEKVPQAGYRIHGLWIAGIQRKKIMANILFLFNFCEFFQALFGGVTTVQTSSSGQGGLLVVRCFFVGNLMGSKMLFTGAKFISRNYQ